MSTDDARPGPPATVTACPDGPLLVRGDFEVLLADGSPAPRRRATVALCRCGASAIKPYCDASHKVIGFTTADEARTGSPADGGRATGTADGVRATGTPDGLRA